MNMSVCKEVFSKNSLYKHSEWQQVAVAGGRAYLQMRNIIEMQKVLLRI